jgi:chemotaxis protein CheX
LHLSAQEVFSLMLGCGLEMPKDSAVAQGLDITAMVGMAGQVCGIVTTRCSVKAAERMASLMLGVDAAKAGEHMWDAVGEICNMIAGNFKNKINSLGDGCMLSVPTVITGGDYNLHAMADEELRIVLLFEGEPLVFGLEVHR